MTNGDKELIEIKIKYDNGEEKIVKQGAVINFEALEDDEVNATFHFLGISGQDLNLLVTSVVQLGMKLGMFDDEEAEE